MADTSRWYTSNEPAAAAQPPAEPLIGERELARSNARFARTADGTPTIYRPDALLVDAAEVRRSPEAIGELNARLAPLGWSIETPVVPDDADEVVLELVGSGAEKADAKKPDAMTALDALRNAGGLNKFMVDLVETLSLQRMLLVGLPAKDPFSVFGKHVGTAREALAVLGPAPARRMIDAVPGGRRPVVAVLDSGVGHHPWLDAAATDNPAKNPFDNPAKNPFNDPAKDPFWVDAMQLGWAPPVDAPPSPNRGNIRPADGDVDTHAGHGTFIAGVIRQQAPDAQVLSLHVMRGDGVLDESLVLHALRWLVARVRRASEDPAFFVDVVCLSFGYYEQQPEDARHTAKLRAVLGELGDLGVRVVASAGNHGNASPVYPAAFAGPRYEAAAPPTPLISVGALNPDGSRAAYSNHGDWVRQWAVGTSVVSTMPSFGRRYEGRQSAEYDPDNLVGGFARWSGTSFASAVFAGRLAWRLTEDPRCAAIMLDMGDAAAHRRAAWAYEGAEQS